MRVFLDFEASSLGKHSYPIEVGWVFEDGRSEAHLIKPAPQWVDWDPSAEALHGISRSVLEAEGTAHDVVANRVLEALAEHVVYSNAPSWDGMWLSMLFRGAGLPRHAMRLKDSDEAYVEAAAEPLRPLVASGDLDAVVAGVIARAQDDAAQVPVSHRALDDAKGEWRMWLEIRRLANEEVAQRRAQSH
jgi:hypothetical protein